MRRISIAGLACAVAMGLAASGAVAGSETETRDGSERRACNTINLGGPKVFSKHNMRCEKAKRYARRVYESNGEDEPRHFSCSSGSNFNEGGFCEHDSKPKFFGWHPAD